MALRARGVLAAGLAEDQALAHVVPDDAGFGRRGGEMNHASDDPVGGHGRRKRAIGIQALQPQLAAAERRRSKNHQGTPFIAVTMPVSGPSSGPMPAATSGRFWAFTATIT
jgi:hypothetical protein